MRVAVVGAGIGGCVAADGIRSRLGPDARIAVFEREERVGGRMLDREIAGARVETGATLHHSSNRLVAGLAAELGLEPVDMSGRPQTVGIRDGDRIVPVTRLRMLARYRASLPRAARAVRDAVERLEAVYERLDEGAAWRGPRELLADLDLAGLCDEPAGDFMARRRIGGRFVREFADGVSRNNYGQHAGELSAFVDLVSLAGAGLGGGSLHRLRGGNAQLGRGLLERAGAEVRLGAAVEYVERAADGWRVADGDFDAVVLAAPLELSRIELRGVDPPAAARRTYREIHATFVAGHRAGPDFVLTTEACGALLSVEKVATRDGGAPLHKVFTRGPLPDGEFDRLFAEVEHVETVEWRAYPDLPPMSPWAPFELGPGLYYPSAMEYAVSTMETQAIAGRAVANLLAAKSGR